MNSQNLSIPPDPLYDTLTAGANYCGPEADLSFRQHSPPVIPSHGAIPPYAGGNLPEHAYPLCDSPATNYGRTEGYPPSSGATSKLDQFSGAMPPRSSDLDRAYTPYTAADRHCPPSDNTAWGSPAVVRETGPSSGVMDLSVSGRPEGIEDDETAGKPKGPPPLGTSNLKSRNPKKRKKPDAQEKPRKVKCARYSRSQHDHDPQRSTQVCASQNTDLVRNYDSQPSHL